MGYGVCTEARLRRGEIPFPTAVKRQAQRALAMAFPRLDPVAFGVDSPAHPAQRYLESAYDSVSSLIQETYPALRAQRTASRGRLTHAEQDLFRAAVVFAGAGVDAVLKQALRSCVPLRIEKSDAARGKYVEFVTRHIQDGAGLSAKRVAELLTAGVPEARLREFYIQFLTGSSLQSREQVTNSLSALGIENADLYKETRTLDPLFKARNQIAHEMDLTPAAQERTRGSRTRHERSLQSYQDMCHAGLNYCQRVLNTLAEIVESGVDGA